MQKRKIPSELGASLIGKVHLLLERIDYVLLE